MSTGGIRVAGMRAGAGLACALLIALAGCGSEDTTAVDPAASTASASESPSAGATQAGGPPGCAETWQAGSQLPRGYDGCLDDTGQTVAPDARYCEFGKPLVTYADRFYAVPGGRIAEAAEPFATDPAYQRVLAACSG